MAFTTLLERLLEIHFLALTKMGVRIAKIKMRNMYLGIIASRLIVL